MIHFLKLIRPINLTILLLTMYSVRLFYIDIANLKINEAFGVLHEQIDFFLLVFSTILIAAGGNIINDYFDVKADRINRPERLIISKHIKQRYAILSHWILNGIAFSIAIYLSIRYLTFWYVFVHLISINALWFYSMYFKKKALIGNFLVASLTALVPILAGIHFYLVGNLQITDTEISIDSSLSWISYLADHGKFVFGMAFFAFLLNFAREIIKDIQDIAGDVKIHANTLPILIGAKKSAFVASSILLIVPFTFLLLYFFNIEFIVTNYIYFIPFILAVILAGLIGASLLLNQSQKMINLSDLLIKIAMLMGLILPFYWKLSL